MASPANDPALVDRTLEGIAALLDLFFAPTIKSIYLFGSQTTGDADSVSDIDLLIVVHPTATSETVQRIEETLRTCSFFSLVSIDAAVVDEADMADFGAALLSEHALLVFGTDVRPTLSYPPPDLVAATLSHLAFAAIASYFPGRGPLPKPLAPANPDDAWLGFGQNSLWTHNGLAIPNVKRLATLVIRIVQGLIAVRTGRMIHPKAEVLAVEFRAHVGGPWADYVEAVLRRYRQEWRCRIPVDDEDRRALRQFCSDAYPFAEWFLGTYRQFLVADLRHPDDARRRLARRNLIRLPFPSDLV